MKTKNVGFAMNLIVVFVGLVLVMFEILGITTNGYIPGIIILALGAVLLIRAR